MRRYNLSRQGMRVFRRGVLWSACANIANMMPPLILLMAVIDIVRPLTGGAPYVIEPWKYLLAFLVVLLATGITQTRKYRATFCDTYEESSRRRIAIAERLRLLPLSFFSKRDLADLTTVVMSDAENSEHAMSHAIPQLWGMMLSVVLSAVLLVLCDWRMALACLWVIPVALGIVFAGRSAQRRHGRAVSAAKLTSAQAIQDIIECAQDIRACNRQEIADERLGHQFALVEGLQRRYETAASVALTSARSFLQLGIATTLLAGVTLLSSGSLSIPVFFLFVLVAVRIYDPVIEMLMNILEVFAVDVSNERLAAIEEHPVAGGSTSFSPERFDISFEGVCFSYEEGASVLEDVSFVARQGEITALVGPSGSGKTTTSKLAARLWDVQGGSIRLGGTDVTSVDPETLLSNFSQVFQDVVLFRGSVRENIRLGRRGATDEEVEAAAHAAQCDEFVTRLPRGLDSELAENGATLSGGERQRISIARALLKDAPIILLDEATASLDPESETRVQKAIAALTLGKTVLMVAHRMRTVLRADHIVVLDKGHVVEDGTPQELLARAGLFAHLCQLQGVFDAVGAKQGETQIEGLTGITINR
ncbi:MAG: ABC transporter ATP-binding protein/permease [Coriobacteriales bacterium]|jgi:ATP-binding cassette subfamily B protein|nr:ABC transporter ATP-binding protein/permease [Coriobacteriales bacterium]